MIVNKSFKYDTEEHSKVHEWVERNPKFSEAIRQLIERECGEVDPVTKALQEIRQQISGLRLSSPVTPQQEAELIEIEQTVEQVERQEIKSINPTNLKSRYGL